ncbi:transcriptional regulator [Bacillus sp. AFS002410]|uniref:helix-turn-helix domain-containing protein n=1 Tax=Bacillus sp. AFS002410 TaxID=2033481 RepID=UPI000BF22EE1|nr:helix-turn-helix transcriptional regulator [Bacillus sp. AFS002410]PEJ58168.1 transcriptional regulator [Bacillus sp. AFS002410]
MKIDHKKIRDLRRGKKITLLEMSERLGFKSANGYYYLESDRCSIKAEILAEIAKILGVKLEELFFEQNFTEMVTEST